jgi:hypothetical protein
VYLDERIKREVKAGRLVAEKGMEGARATWGREGPLACLDICIAGPEIPIADRDRNLHNISKQLTESAWDNPPDCRGSIIVWGSRVCWRPPGVGVDRDEKVYTGGRQKSEGLVLARRSRTRGRGLADGGYFDSSDGYNGPLSTACAWV